jgi:hypothetical protein
MEYVVLVEITVFPAFCHVMPLITAKMLRVLWWNLLPPFQGGHKIFTLKKGAGDFFETAVNFYQHILLHDFRSFSIYICHIIASFIIK